MVLGFKAMGLFCKLDYQFIRIIYTMLLELLQKTKIPYSYKRPNVLYDDPSEYTTFKIIKGKRVLKWKRKMRTCQSISFGKYREMFCKNPQIRDMKNNEKFPELFEELKRMVIEFDPDFQFDTITLNKNLVCKKHIDKYNKGDSYIYFLGDFEGGALLNENGERFEKKNVFHPFNGQIPHWNEEITSGTKFSIIWFKRFKNSIHNV